MDDATAQGWPAPLTKAEFEALARRGVDVHELVGLR